MIPIKSFIHQYKIHILVIACITILCFILRSPLLESYHFLTDRDALKQYIDSWGSFAPLVFMALQVLQVIFAPVPGEISGFVGGYLFGATKGFIFSSLGLAAGSAINFWLGRFLGHRFVRKIIPEQQLKRFDRFVSHQGIVVLLFLFMFPGFPKDYLCLLLGITTLPFPIFILLAGFGRMPGTLMLSLHGEFLFARNYRVFGIALVVSLAVVGIAFKYRKTLYRWADQISKR